MYIHRGKVKERTLNIIHNVCIVGLVIVNHLHNLEQIVFL
jgi:hypothetical protein